MWLTGGEKRHSKFRSREAMIMFQRHGDRGVQRVTCGKQQRVIEGYDHYGWASKQLQYANESRGGGSWRLLGIDNGSLSPFGSNCPGLVGVEFTIADRGTETFWEAKREEDI